jgi:hypothetical protein
MSALCQKQTKCNAAKGSVFDHLVGAHKEYSQSGASSSSLPSLARAKNHIGGVSPFRPTRQARPSSVPSGCLAAMMKTFAPALRSLLSPGT